MHTDRITNITKNEQYILHLQLWNSSGTPAGMVTGKISQTGTLKISKDGEAYTDTTNSLVEIGSGLYSITLTASEMNADVISIYRAGTSSDVGGFHALITTGSSSGVTAQEIWEYATRTITGGGIGLTTELTDDGVLTGNCTVGDVLKALFYFLKRNKNRKTITM